MRPLNSLTNRKPSSPNPDLFSFHFFLQSSFRTRTTHALCERVLSYFSCVMALCRLFFPISIFLLFSLSAIPPPAAAATADKVSLGLYYESLCPYSANFIVNYLAKIFNNGLLEIVDLNLVPYGNARISSNNTITCQHGPYECLLNSVEACSINAWPDVNKHFSFIYCVESVVLEHKYDEWESCFQKIGLDSEPVVDCFNTGNVEKLELQYAAETDALKPPHKYVPWVVVDGQPLYEDYEDFETYICKAYKGDLPTACKALPFEMREKKLYQPKPVSYAEESQHSLTISVGDQMDRDGKAST